jgi:uncharacterized membrane protein YgaE (UPF0421/DUF939 family)
MTGSKCKKMKTARLTSWDLVYATSMAIACFISYWIMTHTLYRVVDKPSALLGGMWAAVATIFVYRETSGHSLSAGIARLIATSISFALCLLYLLFFPFTAVGMAVLIGIGTAVLALMGRRSEFVTTAITTAVVMVVAALSPRMPGISRCCGLWTRWSGSRSASRVNGSGRHYFPC